MNKILSITMDVIDCIVNDELEKIAETADNLSAEAKSAYIPTYEEFLEHSDKDFAAVLWHPNLGKFNKFAKFDKHLTEININLLANNINNIPEDIVKVAAANLTCSAKNFNLTIPDSLKKYASDKYVPNLIDIRFIKTSNESKKEDTKESSEYALSEKKKYPINSASNVKKASAFFEKNSSKLEPFERYEFAINTVSAAEKYSVPLEKTKLQKYASLNPNTFNDDLFYVIQTRKNLLKENEDNIKQNYDELLRRCDEFGPVKTAQLLYELDKTVGLDSNYEHGVLEPISGVFGSIKTAGLEIDGYYVTMDQLKNLDSGDLTAIVGNDAIPELKGSEGLNVLASLPKPIRQDVLNLL